MPHDEKVVLWTPATTYFAVLVKSRRLQRSFERINELYMLDNNMTKPNLTYLMTVVIRFQFHPRKIRGIIIRGIYSLRHPVRSVFGISRRLLNFNPQPPEELGRSGVDQLPNPLSMPASLRATFDTRQVGLLMLTSLLAALSN